MDEMNVKISPNYYFVASSLPALRLYEPAEIKFDDFITLVQTEFKPSDFAQVREIRTLTDINNLSSYWRGEPIDPRGNMSLPEMEEALSTLVGWPEYVYPFLERYTSKEERIRHFSFLLVSFFREEIPLQRGFIQKYLMFEREWRLVMLGLRAKQLGRDVTVELQYEDPADTIVGQILAQRDTKAYEPPDGYEDLKGLFDEKREEPLALQKALYAYRFNKIESLIEGEILFSLDYILGYMVQLMIIENMQELEV